MRRGVAILILLLTSAVALSCVTVEERAAPSAEPWIVTATGILTSNESLEVDLTVNYTDLAGRDSQWRWKTPFVGTGGLRENPIYACWRTVVIGEPLPDCIRRAFE